MTAESAAVGMTSWAAFRRVVAVEMVAVGMAFFAISFRQFRRRWGVDHPEFPLRLFRRRLMPALIGYAMVALTGVSLLVLRAPEFFYLIIGAFCMLLGNATGASWDLLVRTARIRREGEASKGRVGAQEKADVG